MAPGRPSRRSFTLTELMVAVLILLVVIVATSKIFATASKVTGLGQAGAEVLQEAVAIQRQMRSDVERLSREGFFAIRCVAVRNSVNLANNGPLLDPGLPPDTWVRADQLVFFTQGVQSVQGFRAAAGTQRKGQGTAARVYYGHAFQVTQGPPAEVHDSQVTYAIDLNLNPTPGPVVPVMPWYQDSFPFREFHQVVFRENASGTPKDYEIAGAAAAVNVTQPGALQWLLARQAVALVDDGGLEALGGFNVYLEPAGFGTGGTRSTKWISDPAIINGRVDASAARVSPSKLSGLGAIRKEVINPQGDGGFEPWSPQQRNVIGDLVFYPRAERHAPSMNRVDQALTSHVIAGACSSFTVDWTYGDGVGSVFDPNNPGAPTFPGVDINPGEQPWFGLDPRPNGAINVIGPRGVQTLENWTQLPGNPGTSPIRAVDIERVTPAPISDAGDVIQDYSSSGEVIVYEAYFGYNQARPLDAEGDERLAGVPDAYTPWPTAVRVTMTMHDPSGKLAVGRVVQFVLELPSRN